MSDNTGEFRRSDSKDFMKKLLASFKIEAAEHLRELNSSVTILNQSIDENTRNNTMEIAFRAVHSLKGAARAVNINELERTCQALESVFSSLKRKMLSWTSETGIIISEAANLLQDLLVLMDSERPLTSERNRISALVEDLKAASRGNPSPGTYATPPASVIEKPVIADAPAPLPNTIRIFTSKLDSIFYQTEEMLSAKLEVNQIENELHEFSMVMKDLKQSAANLSERNSLNLELLQSRSASLAKLVQHHKRSMGSMIDQLLETTKTLLMLPFSSGLELFPKLVRDLSRDQSKDVELQIKGADLEVDKRILEELKDPLVHLLRNSIDHGMEKSDERIRNNKSPRGTIKLEISQKEGGKVDVRISDDGSGIDPSKVRDSAIKLGILSQAESEKLSDKEILPFIFSSGLSTSPIITDISGQGIGLAIVREKVERLGGSVSVESQKNIGTTIELTLPLTLANFRGVIVRSAGSLFAIPIVNLKYVISAKKTDIRRIENREILLVHGESVSFVDLADVLELPVRPQSKVEPGSQNVSAVILSYADQEIAFSVDEILGVQELVVKSLGPQLRRVRNVAGAAVLGTREVVPILNSIDIMKSAVNVTGRGRIAESPQNQSNIKKRVLVTDDSITARSLVKNILEATGYDVTTAVDGMDALTTLRSGEFDIVVSDVEMPRMNGFLLTERIRADKRLAELPVILVTALDSREDREKGIQVGANAYIVKSSFDQSNLLEIIGRLI